MWSFDYIYIIVTVQVKPGVPPNWPMILVSWYGANAYALWAALAAFGTSPHAKEQKGRCCSFCIFFDSETYSKTCVLFGKDARPMEKTGAATRPPARASSRQRLSGSMLRGALRPCSSLGEMMMPRLICSMSAGTLARMIARATSRLMWQLHWKSFLWWASMS